MNTYRIHYTRHDPVYGKCGIVLYYSHISAKRTVKAANEDQAVKKVIKAATKDRPESKVEIKVGGIYKLEEILTK